MFSYDPATGKLFRKPLNASYFAKTKDPRGATWQANNYNSQFAGREAFTHADPGGYKHGKVLGTKYQAHRIIWKLVYGVDPDTIDHRNGLTADNRLENLRDCSIAENSRNYAKPKGSSQYRGVCWVKRDGSWAARISVGAGGKKSLGNFKDEVDAARAYDRAAREFHGEIATLNFPVEA
jgi:hypothetical protein